ncbi:baseplate J/gp47 family protein [Lonepinella koalarum]|uniref:Putative phage protein gp47/JayE n=1 Tax=Lonepinella koalarum TaxID=53417 RepID=A0A4R1KSS4_9PAST|nr:baseplate J/gp47 family protein [Lonepinella koalarum]MDH2927214.1 hypothetical protein [Lonepinella koalarum]TCK68116.1 putative phage protein gp47/JayE [Lonepinella koalarum]TFJ89484.1 baseplate J/gp47 family protein [Lonepinella koalarum]
MTQITENGVEIDRLDDIVEKLEQGFKGIYGQNINVAPDSPDGQMIGILAQIIADHNELLETAYKQMDPDLASGVWLDQRVAYAGLVRRQASYSILPSVILTGEPNTLIPKGVVVSDPNKVRWVLQTDTQLNENGSAQADFQSEELGAFNLTKNTTLTIETVVFGLSGATSYADSLSGDEEETDAELRTRFFLSRSRNAQNSIMALESQLLGLDGVSQVSILENNSNETDSNGLPAHAINVIVLGGDDNQIAETIYEQKGAGVPLKGSVKVDLNKDGKVRTIQFDKAQYIDIYFELIAVRYEDFTEIDQDQIKVSLTKFPFKIGETVKHSRLYSPINTVGGFWIQELKIGRSTTALSTDNIAISVTEIARILPENIQIEVR